MQRRTTERRGAVVHQGGLEEGLEEVLQRAESIGAVLLQGQDVQVAQGPHLPGHVRREPGVLRRELEEEVQGAHGTLFRDQTPVPAAAQVDQVHQVRVRGRRAHVAQVDVGHTHRQVRATAAGELRVGADRRQWRRRRWIGRGGRCRQRRCAPDVSPRGRRCNRQRNVDDAGGHRERAVRLGLVVRLRRGVRVGLPAVRHHQAQAAQVAADGHHATADVLHGGGRRLVGGRGRGRSRHQRACEPTAHAETGQVGQVCRRGPPLLPSSPTAAATATSAASTATAAASSPTAATASATTPPLRPSPPDAQLRRVAAASAAGTVSGRRGLRARRPGHPERGAAAAA